MAKVTFLLGAGASANCLPTYTNFYHRFDQFTKLFAESNEHFKSLDEFQRNDAIGIRNLATGILEEFAFHNTPDTIAKKYFHSAKDDGQLVDLKRVLILFFIYQQIVFEKNIGKTISDPNFREPLDKRYDAFIASILKPIRGKLELYNQFKVLSWNYDLQFEIAFSRYQSLLIPHCQKLIQSYPLIFPDGNERFDLSEFGIIHLNGIAYARQGNSFNYTDYFGEFIENGQWLLTHLTNVYHALRTTSGEIGGTKLLSFAWEKQKEDSSLVQNDLFKNALLIAEQTEILTIIGYSFPIFNNPIDKMILGSMRNLERIYIQSPQANDIKNLLVGDLLADIQIHEKNIIDVGYWNQFYIPREWNTEREPGVGFEFR